jgi:hypothetical protein
LNMMVVIDMSAGYHWLVYRNSVFDNKADIHAWI